MKNIPKTPINFINVPEGMSACDMIHRIDNNPIRIYKMCGSKALWDYLEYQLTNVISILFVLLVISVPLGMIYAIHSMINNKIERKTGVLVLAVLSAFLLFIIAFIFY